VGVTAGAAHRPGVYCRFEALTLIQTRKIVEFPVILMGKAYWTPILDLLTRMVEQETISAADLDLLLLTDSVDEAATHIQTHALDRFGLHKRRVSPRSRFLWE
jgi:predicted Rossmann-fold nucleotide-binding protein